MATRRRSGFEYARRILEWHASLPYTVVLDNGR
jgi:hypothetical protein